MRWMNKELILSKNYSKKLSNLQLLNKQVFLKRKSKVNGKIKIKNRKDQIKMFIQASVAMAITKIEYLLELVNTLNIRFVMS